MSNLQEQFFRSVEIIADQKISQIKFDKTIECIIVSDLGADKGEYQAQYQDIIIPVYSNNNTVKYKNSDNVYISVPQGDFSNKKIIVGKKDDTGEEFLDIESIIEKVQTIGDNYIREPEISSFNLKPGTSQIKELAFRSEDFMADYKNKTNLLIGANIETNLLNEEGDFGLELDLTYKSGIRHRYRMSINSMTGNPYKLERQYQYKVFPLILDEVVSVNGMYLYCDGFANSVTSNFIKFTNVEVAYAKPKEVEGLDQFSSTIIAPQGTIFKNGAFNPNDYLTLEMSVRKVGKEFKPNAQYKWFFMDSTVNSPDVNNGWDSDGGLGWRLINTEVNDYSNTIAIEQSGRVLKVKADFIPNIETFKCVSIFGGETINYPDGTSQSYGVIKLESIESIVDQTDSVIILIDSTKGDLFKEEENVETTELVCKVMVGAEQMEADKFLYSWSTIGKDGSIKPLATLSTSEKLTVDVKNDIINTENYICEVFLKIK